MIVRAYTKHNTTHEFEARDLVNAREIAKRIITEGLWLAEQTTETFYPITELFKVKILKEVSCNLGSE